MVVHIFTIQDTWLGFSPSLADRADLLHQAAQYLGLSQPPSLPHPQVSLSHSPYGIIVAGIDHPDVSGVGVDLEAVRPLPLPRALRFFAIESEQAWWQQQPNPDVAAIQLWTQKEAAYKAYMRQDRRLLALLLGDWQPVTHPLSGTESAYSSWTWRVTHPHDARTGWGLTFYLPEVLTQGPGQWLSLCWLA